MRRKRYYKKRRGRKRGRGLPYIYKNRVYLEKKTSSRYWDAFKSSSSFARKRWKGYWNLMIKRKHKRKIKRKFNRKYKRKIRGKGIFGDAFRTLGSFSKLHYKALGGK